MPDTKPTSSIPGLSSEAALIIGVAVAALNAVVTVAGLGAFDDGLQWADLLPILIPVLGALGIRQEVYSKRTVALKQRTGAGPRAVQSEPRPKHPPAA